MAKYILRQDSGPASFETKSIPCPELSVSVLAVKMVQIISCFNSIDYTSALRTNPLTVLHFIYNVKSRSVPTALCHDELFLLKVTIFKARMLWHSRRVRSADATEAAPEVLLFPSILPTMP